MGVRALTALCIALTTSWAYGLAEPVPQDSVHVPLGSTLINARSLLPFRARQRSVIDGRPPQESAVSMTLRDSAGRRVMRMATRGTIRRDADSLVHYELVQSFDARTFALVAYSLSHDDGDTTRLTVEGKKVRGVRSVRAPARVTLATRRMWMFEPVDLTLDKPGFDIGIVTMLPVAVGFRAGLVITAPVVNHSAGVSGIATLTVISRETIRIDGSRVEAWKVEERGADRRLRATWHLTDRPPYLVSGEVVVPGGQIMRLTRVLL